MSDDKKQKKDIRDKLLKVIDSYKGKLTLENERELMSLRAQVDIKLKN